MLLNNVSWQAYWTVLALSVAGYYVIIYLLYFRKDAKGLLASMLSKDPKEITSTSVPYPFSSGASPSKTDVSENLDLDSGGEAPEEEAAFSSCSDEILAFLEEAGEAEMNRPEILFGLQRIARKYPTLSGPYLEDLQLIITSSAERFCSVHLSDEDLIHVWMKG